MLGRFDHSCPQASILPEGLWVLHIAPAPELPRIVHGEDRPFLMLFGSVFLGVELRVR